MTNEVPDRTDVIRYFLGERQGRTYQPRDALVERIVKALAVIDFPRFLGDGFVPLYWDHTVVDFVLIFLKCRDAPVRHASRATVAVC